MASLIEHNSGINFVFRHDVRKLPEEINYKKNKLILKSEFHTNLMNLDFVAEQYGQNITDRVVDIFKKHLNKIQCEQISLTGEFRYVEDQRGRRTIIAMVDVPGLSDVYDSIRAKLKLSFDYYPTHVTLYAFGKDMGIWVNDHYAIEKMTKLIDDKNVLETLKQAKIIF